MIPTAVDETTTPPPASTEKPFRYWSWWLVLYLIAWATTYGMVAPRPIALFEHNWIFIVVGFCGAVLGNISAVGGGIVFIPVITLIQHHGK